MHTSPPMSTTLPLSQILNESGNPLCIFFAAVTFLHWHPEEPQDAFPKEETAVLQTPRVATNVKIHQYGGRSCEARTGRPVARTFGSLKSDEVGFLLRELTNHVMSAHHSRCHEPNLL